jgi:hypothetical protein
MPTLWLLVGMVVTMPGGQLAWFKGEVLDNTQAECQQRGQVVVPRIIGNNPNRGVFWTCFDITTQMRPKIDERKT